MAPGIFHKGNGTNSRGRSYGLIFLLAFGATVFGLMVVHKLRERRIFNLLVQEKDRQLISLQLHLQKERDYAKEMKRKTEEMNAKLNSLQNKKMELDGRLLEMQSTIKSVQDEQKVLERTLDKKRYEIKWLRKRNVDSRKENPQLIALIETLKQKEAEIEDLKHQVESPIKKDVNLTRGEIGSEDNSTAVRESLKSSLQTAGRDNGGTATHLKHTIREQIQTVETLRGKDDAGEENGHKFHEWKNASSPERAGSDTTDVKNTAHSSDTNSENSNNDEKFSSYEGSAIPNDGKDLNVITDGGNKGGLGNTHGGETAQSDVSSEGGMKMEMLKSNRSADLRGKHGQLTRSKGKRWRTIANDRLT